MISRPFCLEIFHCYVVQTFEIQRGAILSLGWIIGRLLARVRSQTLMDVDTDGADDESASKDIGVISDLALSKVVKDAVEKIG